GEIDLGADLSAVIHPPRLLSTHRYGAQRQARRSRCPSQRCGRSSRPQGSLSASRGLVCRSRSTRMESLPACSTRSRCGSRPAPASRS
ncbi:hypothetical protein T492DRAFT_1084292, partial [Pavlovales sp. CCMP2436]